jgi:AcrR family transcriptional regulator
VEIFFTVVSENWIQQEYVIESSHSVLAFVELISGCKILSNSLKKIPKQDRSRSTVEAIIEAAARIIEANGLAALSTNRVAELAGVSVGSLYQYFPNKEALVEEVRERFGLRFQASMLELLGRLPGLGLREAIRAWVTMLVDLHAESPGVHNAVGTGTPAEAHGPLAVVIGGYLDSHADEIRRSDRTLAARVLMDAAEALVHNTSLREPALLEDPRWVDEVCDLLERYLVVDEP